MFIYTITVYLQNLSKVTLSQYHIMKIKSCIIEYPAAAAPPIITHHSNWGWAASGYKQAWWIMQIPYKYFITYIYCICMRCLRGTGLKLNYGARGKHWMETRPKMSFFYQQINTVKHCLGTTEVDTLPLPRECELLRHSPITNQLPDTCSRVQ